MIYIEKPTNQERVLMLEIDILKITIEMTELKCKIAYHNRQSNKMSMIARLDYINTLQNDYMAEQLMVRNTIVEESSANCTKKLNELWGKPDPKQISMICPMCNLVVCEEDCVNKNFR